MLFFVDSIAHSLYSTVYPFNYLNAVNGAFDTHSHRSSAYSVLLFTGLHHDKVFKVIF